MTSTPVLKAPDFKREFVLHCDASKTAYGGVLNQEYDGQEHPVAFLSRSFKGSEKLYLTTEKEALAIVASVRHFTPYIHFVKFVVVTDHSALRYIFKFRTSSNGRLSR